MNRSAHRQAGWLAAVLLAGVLTGLGCSEAQELTRDRLHRITFEAEREFAQMVQLWKDRRFAELYARGTLASQGDLSPEAFVRYMGYATRALECCWQTLHGLHSRFAAPDRVYVTARLGFKHKEFLVMHGQHHIVARGATEEETLTFLLQREAHAWRINLFRILALSGVPLDLPGSLVPLFRPY
jgi:hypothetical protein